MAWSMPPAGQWGPAMGVTPDVNMGNYTPEQWAALQQQNWQQWTQWHQQYATWHSQFGNQYSEQFQAMQMGGMPPLPPANAAPPPAPPPPDKPPPPPPHENNQPLYGHAQQQPVTGIASGQKTVPFNKMAEVSSNNQNRPFATDAVPENSVNSEALRTLAEEQKAFDIQFQQWEDEFEKWKKANINHPDKKAYKEYEQTFESCKARLLERRMQMKQKRARLLNTDKKVPTSAPRLNVAPPAPPPALISSGDYCNKEQTGYPQQNYNNFQNNQYIKTSQYNYRDNNNTNKSFEGQDGPESYNNSNSKVMVPVNMISTEPFIPASEPPKGIPGLDLVPEAEKYSAKPNEVIDITEEPKEKKFRPDIQPDYSTISKGINNILGDEKIMNILSIMRGQPPQMNIPPNHLLPNPTNSLLPNPPKALLPNPPNNASPYGSIASGDNRLNYIGRNNAYSDNNYGMGQNVLNANMNQYNEYDMHEETQQGKKFAVGPPRPYNTRPENHYSDRNQQGSNPGLLPRPGLLQNVRLNAPMRPLMDPQSNIANVEFEQRDMQEELSQPNVPMRQDITAGPPPSTHPKWVVEPLFSPSIIVEYDHKPLRLKACDFIAPVHTFDYNHKSKGGDDKKRDFEREAEELFTRNPRPDREDRHSFDKHSKDLYYRNYDRTSSRETRELREERDYRGEEFDDRRRDRFDDDSKDRRFDDRRRDDRDKFYRREEMYRERDRDEMNRERERDLERIRAREREMRRSKERDRDKASDYNRDRDAYRERNRDFRRSRSREKDNRKRGHSRDSELSTVSKRSKETPPLKGKPKHLVMIDDLLEAPGRQMRPQKIVIIMRGPPGSGKSYVAKLIRDREAEQGGTVRVMSIDDYFMQEGEIEEKDNTGKIVRKPSLKYEYDEKLEESYIMSLKRAFKRSITDGYFSFLIYDAVNEQLRSYADVWNFARQNGFQVYICTLELDANTCFKRNIHNRSLEEIEVICSRFFPTPDHHIQLDPTTLLQSASIPEVQMEDADDDVTMECQEDTEVNSSFTSKWEKMDDAQQLARLDGTSRPLRASQPSMEDYLQLDDWTPTASIPGKKTVRWADIEERREQEKMRAIGFVVGQTDWTRMTDPTMGSAALTQTKYIERVRRS